MSAIKDYSLFAAYLVSLFAALLVITFGMFFIVWVAGRSGCFFFPSGDACEVFENATIEVKK